MPKVKKKSFIQKNGLIAVWSIAGFMAMGYIGFLASGTGTDKNGAIRVARTPDTKTDALPAPVQKKIAALSARVEALTNREKSTLRKLSVIEEALRPTAALPDQKPSPDTASPEAIQPVTSTIAKANVSVHVLPLTENDRIIGFSDDNRQGSFGLNLASARSISSLKRHWSELKKSQPKLFQGLEPHYLDKSSQDLPLYELVVGSFERINEARSYCRTLSAQSIECQETSLPQGRFDKIHTAGK